MGRLDRAYDSRLRLSQQTIGSGSTTRASFGYNGDDQLSPLFTEDLAYDGVGRIDTSDEAVLGTAQPTLDYT